MKSIQSRRVQGLKIFLASCGFLIAVSCLYSFTRFTLRDDFLKQLGINKTSAEEKITQSFLGGSFDSYGIKNVKNILLQDRRAITSEVLTYTRQYLQSASFRKEYEALRQKNKPAPRKPETTEELRAKNIAVLRKTINETAATLKKANATMKPVYEKMLAEGNKQLAEVEDPNNKQYARYEKNYPQLVKDMEAENQLLIKNWESKYPSDPLQFVKGRLEEFLTITRDIDFSAALTAKNGKQYFVNPDYEKKDKRWKMAFRAGIEVVDPARVYVQQWVNEIR